MAYTKTNWVNGTTPINATNLNHIEDGIESVEQEIPSVYSTPRNTTTTDEVYNCGYINYIEANLKNANTYSTNEIDTGKIWIDGKHIYRKVFTKTSGISTGSGNVGSISSFETLVALRGMLKAGATTSPMPSANTSDLGWQTNLYIANSTGSITYEIGGNYSPVSMIVIVEYTKSS